MIWTNYLTYSIHREHREFNRPFNTTESQMNHLNTFAEVFRNIKVIKKFNRLDITYRPVELMVDFNILIKSALVFFKCEQ